MYHFPSQQQYERDDGRTNRSRPADLTRNETKLAQAPAGSGQAAVQQQNTKYSRKIRKSCLEFRVSIICPRDVNSSHNIRHCTTTTTTATNVFPY